MLARNEKHQIIIASSDDDEETEFDVIENLASRKINGLIVASVMKKDQITNEILKLKIPVVYLDRRIEADMVSWVAGDNVKESYELTSLVCKRGSQNPFYLGETSEISTSRNRINGYRKALEENSVNYNLEYVYQDDDTIASGYRLMEKIQKRIGEIPISFITGSFTLLEGELSYINEATGTLPGDLQIGTYDDHPILDYLSLKFPSVRQNTIEMARSAINMILGALKGENIVQHEIIEPTLIFR